MERKYGWARQPEDLRDLKFGVSKPIPGLPESSNLIGLLPPCWDQLQTSDCISHGVSGGLVLAQVRAKKTSVIIPSRLYNYWNFRDIEGDTTKDEGGYIRDGVKAVNLYGFPDESLWPFTPDTTLFTKPPQSVYDAAATNKIHLYASVDLANPDNIKLALSHGMGVIFGFDVPKYFESSQMESSGIIRLSDFNRIIGGHCNIIVGHENADETWWVRNSWSPSWCPQYNGNYKMGWDVTSSNHASDGWVIRMN
jgi:Papain family cysteine protease